MVLIALLVITYALSPEFYLQYVLELKQRERQAVEIVTVTCALIASVMMAYAAVRLWRRGVRWAALHVGLLAAASFFFGGEEINYGQVYFMQEQPGQDLQLNIHNADLPFSIQSLGSLFLIAMFLVLPILWAQRPKVKLPDDLAPSVPEWPVVVMFVITLVWSKVKSLYAATLEGNPKDHKLYSEFFEQINEQKEMLFAVMLLVYAIYRVVAVRRLKSA